MSTRVRLSIAGRVQGVGYRAWLKRRAEGLGLSGWVRNRADGSVEAVIEGAPDAVATLVEAARRGPPLASVATVERADEPTDEALAPGIAVRPTF